MKKVNFSLIGFSILCLFGMLIFSQCSKQQDDFESTLQQQEVKQMETLVFYLSMLDENNYFILNKAKEEDFSATFFSEPANSIDNNGTDGF